MQIVADLFAISGSGGFKPTDFVGPAPGMTLAQSARSMTARPSRGFTLLELMVVVAIIGLVSSMAAATATRIGSRNATQNAASDLSSMLQKARARAEQRGSDVYVIVYPTMTRTGVVTGGSGAIFIYDDANGDFLTGTGGCTGSAGPDCSWANFVPPTNIVPPAASNDRLLEAIYLDNYTKKNVRFGKPSTTTFAAPFATISGAAANAGCSFCAAGKGAVVFTGEQQLLFLNNTGAPVAQRVAGLALQGVDNPNNTFLFGLVGATGLVTLVK